MPKVKKIFSMIVGGDLDSISLKCKIWISVHNNNGNTMERLFVGEFCNNRPLYCLSLAQVPIPREPSQNNEQETDYRGFIAAAGGDKSAVQLCSYLLDDYELSPPETGTDPLRIIRFPVG